MLLYAQKCHEAGAGVAATANRLSAHSLGHVSKTYLIGRALAPLHAAEAACVRKPFSASSMHDFQHGSYCNGPWCVGMQGLTLDSAAESSPGGLEGPVQGRGDLGMRHGRLPGNLVPGLR